MLNPKNEVSVISNFLDASVRLRFEDDVVELLELNAPESRTIEGVGTKYAYLWSDLFCLHDIVKDAGKLIGG